MTKTEEFVTAEFANKHAREMAEKTLKAVYYWFDRQTEKFKVQYESEE